MARVTSKLQLTLPKAVADKHGIRPGDEFAVHSSGQGFASCRPGLRSPRRRICACVCSTRRRDACAVAAGRLGLAVRAVNPFLS